MMLRLAKSILEYYSEFGIEKGFAAALMARPMLLPLEGCAPKLEDFIQTRAKYTCALLKEMVAITDENDEPIVEPEMQKRIIFAVDTLSADDEAMKAVGNRDADLSSEQWVAAWEQMLNGLSELLLVWVPARDEARHWRQVGVKVNSQKKKLSNDELASGTVFCE